MHEEHGILGREGSGLVGVDVDVVIDQPSARREGGGRRAVSGLRAASRRMFSNPRI
jgi:hypothetical protein